MKHKINVKIYRSQYEHEILADEYVFRTLMGQLIREIPIEDLKKIFKLTKIDPESNESFEKIKDPKTPIHERDMIMILKYNEKIFFEAELSCKAIVYQNGRVILHE